VVSIITGIVVGVQITHATNSGDTFTSSCTVDEMNAGIC
jgi:hypothetical protein